MVRVTSTDIPDTCASPEPRKRSGEVSVSLDKKVSEVELDASEGTNLDEASKDKD